MANVALFPSVRSPISPPPLTLPCETPASPHAPFSLGGLQSRFSNLPNFASSPVTPRADQSPSPPRPRLLDDESARLECMCRSAKRRKADRAVLVEKTVAVGNASYLELRHHLVEWLVDVVEELSLLPTTLHAAVRHVDWVLSCSSFREGSWQLVASACLIIAAKFEEQIDHVPLLAQLCPLAGDTFTPSVLNEAEVCVLDILNWDPMHHGPIHFLSFSLGALQRLLDAASPSTTSNPSPNGSSPHFSRKRSRADAGLDDFLPTRSPYAPLPPCSQSPSPFPGSSPVQPPPKALKPMSSADTLLSLEHASSLASPVTGASPLFCHSPSPSWSPAVSPKPIREVPRFSYDAGAAGLSGETLSVGRTAVAVLDSALYDLALSRTKDPQLLSAAALFVARAGNGLAPAWPPAYVAATGVTEDRFSDLAVSMMRLAVANNDRC